MEKGERILMYSYPRPMVVQGKDIKLMYRLHKCSNKKCSILTEELFNDVCFNCSQSKLNGGKN